MLLVLPLLACRNQYGTSPGVLTKDRPERNIRADKTFEPCSFKTANGLFLLLLLAFLKGRAEPGGALLPSTACLPGGTLQPLSNIAGDRVTLNGSSLFLRRCCAHWRCSPITNDVTKMNEAKTVYNGLGGDKAMLENEVDSDGE